MSKYKPGDYVKVEFRDENSGESEWMWVRVGHCDDEQQIVFGRLDSEPILYHGEKVRLGSDLAISYNNIREHRSEKSQA